MALVSELRTWAGGRCPFRVQFSAEVIEEIRLAVVDAFFAIPRGGLEIGGVLFGAWRDGELRITEFRPVECDHARGPTFSLSEADHGRLTGLLAGAALADDLRGLAPVGWYRSRTRSEIKLSGEDRDIFDRYFSEFWQIGLVIKPEVSKPTRAAFFYRDADGSIKTEPEVEMLLEPAAKLPVAQPPEADGGPEREPIAAAPYSLVEEEAAELSNRRVSQRQFWLIGLAAVLIGIAALWLTKAVVVPRERLALEVSEREGHLRIQWDRKLGLVRDASGGTLEITEGDAATKTELTGDQLRSTVVFYRRRGKRVDLRLSVKGRSEGSASATFVGDP
ncbi:MAG: hypothetical protein ACRD8O_17935 [Bryobacteraceae bacterium]